VRRVRADEACLTPEIRQSGCDIGLRMLSRSSSLLSVPSAEGPEVRHAGGELPMRHETGIEVL
jgi:hypothetical protein